MDEISLKEYFEKRFDASDKAVTAALASQKEAIIKAENAMEKRFEGVNEFRKTLSDQQDTFMRKDEVSLIVEGLSNRIKILEDAQIKKVGESGGAKNLWLVIVGIVGFISVLFGLLQYL